MPDHLPAEIDEIWRDDLLERRAEAEMLEAYISSVAGRTVEREDARAYSLAVDAGYGEGKSFFLRRLARHLGTRHPVAFVDAWSDDIIDQPLTAIAATLKKALEPLLRNSGLVRTRWRTVLDKTGTVAGIAAKGLFKRGVGLLITAGAVEAADEVLTGVGDAAAGAVKEDLKTAGKDASKALQKPAPRMALCQWQGG